MQLASEPTRWLGFAARVILWALLVAHCLSADELDRELLPLALLFLAIEVVLRVDQLRQHPRFSEDFVVLFKMISWILAGLFNVGALVERTGRF